MNLHKIQTLAYNPNNLTEPKRNSFHKLGHRTSAKVISPPRPCLQCLTFTPSQHLLLPAQVPFASLSCFQSLSSLSPSFCLPFFSTVCHTLSPLHLTIACTNHLLLVLHSLALQIPARREAKTLRRTSRDSHSNVSPSLERE